MSLGLFMAGQPMSSSSSEYRKYVSFDRNVVLLGFGAIGECVLALILRHIGLAPSQIIIVNAGNRGEALRDHPPGIRYIGASPVYPENLHSLLRKHVRCGDLLINVSVNVSSVSVLQWCQANGALYIDTSLEDWEEEAHDPDQALFEQTNYHAHQLSRAIARKNGATAVVTHGANPGIVNHFVKAALLDIAASLGAPGEPPTGRRGWARLSKELGVKVIHISERDTQVSNHPKRPGEFVNTWSIPGFWTELTGPAEMGWGTHEPSLPSDAMRFEDGPGNGIFFDRPGMNTLIRSWVPSTGCIHGFMIQHNETTTLSEFLTEWNGREPAYRPSVCYAYLPCDSALASIHEMRMSAFELQQRERIVKDDVIDGMDELGVLLMGHGANAWWYGSQLDIDETRRLIGPGHNATILQVAAPLLAAIVWAIRNPARGYCEPEDLPHEEILEVARPYLGNMPSMPSDWTPLAGCNGSPPESRDPWAFDNFRVRGSERLWAREQPAPCTD